jgi:hypothetical protein
MSGSDPRLDAERHAIEHLAEEFLQRQRRGEHPPRRE